MKKIFYLFVFLVCLSAFGVAASGRPTMSQRAAVAYDNAEWNSAMAMYTVLAERTPGDARNYCRAITAAQMIGDSVASSQLLARAMAAAVPLDTVLEGVKANTLQLGRNDLYCNFLLQTRNRLPYMTRAINARLLDYYVFRQNPAKMVEYAAIMLQGSPGNTDYLADMAQGYLLGGHEDLAEKTYREILTLDPDNIGALIRLGLLLQDKDSTASRQYLQRAWHLEPTPYLEELLR